VTPAEREAIRARCENVVAWALASYDQEAESFAFARPLGVRPLAEAYIALLSALDEAEVEIERLRKHANDIAGASVDVTCGGSSAPIPDHALNELRERVEEYYDDNDRIASAAMGGGKK